MSSIIFVLGVIGAVFAVCMPFFVFRIRNEVIDTNRNMKTIIALLQKQIEMARLAGQVDPEAMAEAARPPSEVGPLKEGEVACDDCGVRYKAEGVPSMICPNCGGLLSP